MSDESNAPPPEEWPELAPGAIVHVAQVWAFGRLARRAYHPQEGLLLAVDFFGLGESLVLPQALWACPVLAGRPLCHLAPGFSRA